MKDEQRERLIELLNGELKDEFDHVPLSSAINIAEKLLTKGVHVLPIKVEEIKFYDSQMHYMFLIDMESDNECFNQSFGGWKTDQCIGKTVFLTKEAAEKAIADRKNERA